MDIDQEGAEKALELIGQGIKGSIGTSNIALMKINNQFKKKFVKKVKKEEENKDPESIPAGAEADDEYEDPPPLEHDEIKNAMKIIDENHPMKDTPLVRLFPIACCCLRWCKKSNHSDH